VIIFVAFFYDGHLWLLVSLVVPRLDFLDHLPPVQMTIGIVVKAHSKHKLDPKVPHPASLTT